MSLVFREEEARRSHRRAHMDSSTRNHIHHKSGGTCGTRRVRNIHIRTHERSWDSSGNVHIYAVGQRMVNQRLGSLHGCKYQPIVPTVQCLTAYGARHVTAPGIPYAMHFAR